MVEIAQNLGKTLALEAVLPRLLDSLFKIFVQADRGFILIGGSVETLEPMAVRTRDGDESNVQISKTIARTVIEGKQAILSQNAMEDDRFSGGMSIVNLRILSMACAPLLFRDEVYGLIQLDTQNRNKFNADDLNLLAGIAAQAAVWWLQPLASGGWSGIAALVAYGVGAGVTPTCLFAMPSAISGTNRSAPAFGIIMTGRNIGVLLGPVLLAQAYQIAGTWDVSVPIFGGISLTALAIAALLAARLATERS